MVSLGGRWAGGGKASFSSVGAEQFSSSGSGEFSLSEGVETGFDAKVIHRRGSFVAISFADGAPRKTR